MNSASDSADCTGRSGLVRVVDQPYSCRAHLSCLYADAGEHSEGDTRHQQQRRDDQSRRSAHSTVQRSAGGAVGGRIQCKAVWQCNLHQLIAQPPSCMFIAYTCLLRIHTQICSLAKHRRSATTELAEARSDRNQACAGYRKEKVRTLEV